MTDGMNKLRPWKDILIMMKPRVQEMVYSDVRSREFSKAEETHNEAERAYDQGQSRLLFLSVRLHSLISIYASQGYFPFIICKHSRRARVFRDNKKEDNSEGRSNNSWTNEWASRLN